jgi:hypothetical protein
MPPFLWRSSASLNEFQSFLVSSVLSEILVFRGQDTNTSSQARVVWRTEPRKNHREASRHWARPIRGSQSGARRGSISVIPYNSGFCQTLPWAMVEGFRSMSQLFPLLLGQTDRTSSENRKWNQRSSIRMAAPDAATEDLAFRLRICGKLGIEHNPRQLVLCPNLGRRQIRSWILQRYDSDIQPLGIQAVLKQDRRVATCCKRS